MIGEGFYDDNGCVEMPNPKLDYEDQSHPRTWLTVLDLMLLAC